VRVFRVRIGEYPLLADVALAAAAAPRNGRLIRSGEWPEQAPTFERDIPRPVGRFCATHDFTPLRELPLRWPIELRSFISYPAGGGIGWHTDSRDQGWRVYLPIVCGGFFMHRPAGWTQLVPDLDGYANVFHVGPEWRDNWHAVRAERERVVLGVRLLVHPWELPDPWTLIEA
jgi:hypothetical protein